MFPRSALALALACLALCAAPSAAAPRAGNGWMVLSGGGEELAPPDALEIFRNLAGGPDSTIIFIPTASSSLRLSTGEILEVPERAELGPDAVPFARALARAFGVREVRILHTRDRKLADSARFSQAIAKVRAVWLSGGNAGRLIDAYLGTRTQRALELLLRRGGVIGGNSAGAIIQGSYVVRGRADKPVLMARGRERGFGFIPGVAINPHFIAAHRETELVTIVDWHPDLLGIGVDTGAAALVHEGLLQPLGTARIGVYDNVKRPVGWYYMVPPRGCLVLATRKVRQGPCFAVDRLASMGATPPAR